MSHPFTSWVLTPDPVVAASSASAFVAGHDFLLDDSGDLDLSTGDIQFTRGLAAVAQDLWIVLHMFKGEWFLNREIGVPYLANDIVPENESLLGQRYSALKARAAFRKAIMTVSGVESITSLAVSFDNATRIMLVSFNVKTVAGTIEGTV